MQTVQPTVLSALRYPAPPRLPLCTGIDPAPAPCVLVFGCRNEAGDYHYRREWEGMQAEGVLAAQGGLLTAFSRDQPAKVYVQHRIREHAQELWALLEHQGGRAGMWAWALVHPVR